MQDSEQDCPYRCKVIANTAIAHNVHYLTFSKPFEFESGQVISLTLSNEIEPRLYSIASGVGEDHLGILFDVKEDGALTPKLATLAPNDVVRISAPFGSFLATSDPAVWVATGTGVAPFISMVKSGFGNNKLLIQGSRTLEGFYFAPLFEEVLQERYVRCSSQEKLGEIYHGRLTTYLNSAATLPLTEKYYLCGNPLMVNEVRDILIAKGVPFDNILSEIFF